MGVSPSTAEYGPKIKEGGGEGGEERRIKKEEEEEKMYSHFPCTTGEVKREGGREGSFPFSQYSWSRRWHD